MKICADENSQGRRALAAFCFLGSGRLDDKNCGKTPLKERSSRSKISFCPYDIFSSYFASGFRRIAKVKFSSFRRYSSLNSGPQLLEPMPLWQ